MNVLVLFVMAISFIGTIAEKEEGKRREMRNLFVFAAALLVVLRVI